MQVSSGHKPIPTRASKDRIHRFAEDVAKHLGFQPGHVLEPIVARLGGSILQHSPFTQAEAPPSIVVEGQQRFTIHLPSTTSPRRNRFTIAHELGHLFLHYPIVSQQSPGVTMIATRWVDETDDVQRRVEWEANWFAAGFLMPAEHFRSCCTRHGGNISVLADLFDVSEQAVAVRAKALGCPLV